VKVKKIEKAQTKLGAAKEKLDASVAELTVLLVMEEENPKPKKIAKAAAKVGKHAEALAKVANGVEDLAGEE
jgi:hypothetical protein